MKVQKKALFLLVLFGVVLMCSCVTRPRYSDFVGMEKEEALDDLTRLKTGNTIKLVCNWLIWGGLTFWIASIVDTVNYITYTDDFNRIERKIVATPNGQRVAQ